ncbi:hypothetical protein HHI36_024248 [Cryptolaemus montrouzieri]|uniref:Uncharacterized protein n=2 Tax=Cryptolaemus montrouzieri TaxID=559131 RepID=A0ABD2NC39_9CUCU
MVLNMSNNSNLTDVGRAEAIQATEWCIDNFKKLVPIWKKEVYENGLPEWKENKESDKSLSKQKKIEVKIEQEVKVPYIAPHLIQIKASNEEILKRIERFMEKKRNEINISNIAEFCSGDRSSESICARIDSTLKKRKDSKGHLQVDRVLNSYYHRDQFNSEYLMKYIPPNGVEERLQNLESQLTLTTHVPKNIYKRLKFLEERMLRLESISPEYIQFWDKMNCRSTESIRKKYSLWKK